MSVTTTWSPPVFEVHVDPSGLDLHDSLITGPICVELAGSRYPAAGWDDFVVTILGWWCDALAAIATRPVLFELMDGPHAFRIVPQGEKLEVVYLDHERERARATVQRQQVVSAVELAARSVLDECQRRGWHDREIEKLSERLARLAEVSPW